MKRFALSKSLVSSGNRLPGFPRTKRAATGQQIIERLEQRQLLSFTTLASFNNNTTGAAPSGAVLADDNGDIFATASTGGTPGGGTTGTGNGTLDELAKGSTTFTVLAVFNGTNGSGPIDNLLPDSSGDIFGITQAGGANNLGTIFEWVNSGSGSTLKTLVSFNRSTGDEPQGGMTADGLGNLYGTTSFGGASNAGTVYELPRGSATVKVLASFNGTNGHSPIGRLLLDSAGDVFGATEQGGANGVGNIYEVTAGSGTVTSLHSFNAANTSDGSEPLGGLIADNVGNLYGTTAAGGAGNEGTVFEFVPSGGGGTLTSLATFNGTNGKTPIGSLYMDGAGNLFGTSNLGGGGDGDIFAVLKGSGAITEVQSFGGSNGANPGFGLTVDANGNLDGTTSGGGTNGNGTIFSIAITPSAATQLQFEQQPSNTQLGVRLLPSVWVSVEDATGDIVQSDTSTVTLSMSSGEGTLGGTLTATVKNGIAIFGDITVSPSTTGPYTLQATDTGLTTAASHAFSVAAQGFVDFSGMNIISGWSYDPTQSTSAVSIEVDISGGPTQTILANENRGDLTGLIGSPNHGFTYATPMLSVGSHTANVYEVNSHGAKLLMETVTLVSRNSLFYEHYYLDTNPDVALAVAQGQIATGYDHYIKYGQFEGRSPSPYWNESWYLSQNADVAAAVKAKKVTSGFMHFYLYGQFENRPGLLYFDTSYYLSHNSDVASAVTAKALTSAYEHFVLYGQYEGRSPMLYFSSAVYDAHNPSIVPFVAGETITSNYDHYIEFGQYESLVASNFYNEGIYLTDNPDVAAAVRAGTFANGFQHWLEYGQFEGRVA